MQCRTGIFKTCLGLCPHKIFWPATWRPFLLLCQHVWFHPTLLHSWSAHCSETERPRSGISLIINLTVDNHPVHPSATTTSGYIHSIGFFLTLQSYFVVFLLNFYLTTHSRMDESSLARTWQGWLWKHALDTWNGISPSVPGESMKTDMREH